MKILVIHNNYQNVGGEDIAVKNEANFSGVGLHSAGTERRSRIMATTSAASLKLARFWPVFGPFFKLFLGFMRPPVVLDEPPTNIKKNIF